MEFSHQLRQQELIHLYIHRQLLLNHRTHNCFIFQDFLTKIQKLKLSFFLKTGYTDVTTLDL